MFEKFFERYPEFQKTSAVMPDFGRLNARYNALIKRHRDILAGTRVLDLGAHDGRWTFAALKGGAAHVVGVEGRAYLVHNAKRTFDRYGVDPTTLVD